MLTTYHRIMGGDSMAKRDAYRDKLLIELEEARANLREATRQLSEMTAQFNAQLARQAVKDTLRGMEEN